MRGVAGGVILGVPLIYTRETWLHGSSVSPLIILLGLAIAFAANVALCYFIGFRPGRTHRPVEDAIVGMGLSILLSAVLLGLLARFDGGTSFENALGIIALTAMPVSLGFAVGSALAPAEGGEGSGRNTGGVADLAIAAAGALVFALNIAPTAEPVLLAAELGEVQLALLVVASLVLPYAIVFFAEFGGRDQRVAHDGATQGPLIETILAYAVALGISAALLVLFGRIDAIDGTALAQVVVLAFPASIGSALGRLIV